MAGMTFDNFLKRMGAQTNPSVNEDIKPQSKPIVVEEEEEIEIKTPDPEEIYSKEDRSKPEKSVLTEEEVVEKAFDYAKSVIKVVRQNFESEKERRIIFEAVKSAVNLCLGETHQNMQQVSSVLVPPQPPKSKRSPKAQSQPQNQDNKYGYNLDGMDVTDQVKKAATVAPLNLEEVEDFNIKRKVNEKGEVEADISGMTQEDIKAFKILAGVDQLNG